METTGAGRVVSASYVVLACIVAINAFEVYTGMLASFMSTMSLRVIEASHGGLTAVRETQAPE